MADTQIETTIGALVDAEAALNKLAGVKLDAKTRYHVLKLAKLVSAETKPHFYEPRQEAFKEFGIEREPNGQERAKFGPDKILEVPPSKMAAFQARIKDLAAVPVTIPWGPVTLTMLEHYPEFSGADCLALGPLFLMEEPTA